MFIAINIITNKLEYRKTKFSGKQNLNVIAITMNNDIIIIISKHPIINLFVPVQPKMLPD